MTQVIAADFFISSILSIQTAFYLRSHNSTHNHSKPNYILCLKLECCVTLINPLESRGNYSATSNNNEVGTLDVDGWAVAFGTASRSPPRTILAVPNVTGHPSTASVPITVLLYNGPFLYGFNVPVKG